MALDKTAIEYLPLQYLIRMRINSMIKVHEYRSILSFSIIPIDDNCRKSKAGVIEA